MLYRDQYKSMEFVFITNWLVTLADLKSIEFRPQNRIYILKFNIEVLSFSMIYSWSKLHVLGPNGIMSGVK